MVVAVTACGKKLPSMRIFKGKTLLNCQSSVGGQHKGMNDLGELLEWLEIVLHSYPGPRLYRSHTILVIDSMCSKSHQQ
jgi:hypothetical protein